jgi:hypothetical protein
MEPVTGSGLAIDSAKKPDGSLSHNQCITVLAIPPFFNSSYPSVFIGGWLPLPSTDPSADSCEFVFIRGWLDFLSTAFASQCLCVKSLPGVRTYVARTPLRTCSKTLLSFLPLPSPSSVDHMCPTTCICGHSYSPLRASASPRLCVKLIPSRIPQCPPKQVRATPVGSRPCFNVGAEDRNSE